MKEEGVDGPRAPRTREEELAGFLEGKLAGDERRRVLEEAAEDPDRHALLAEASATLAELEAELDEAELTAAELEAAEPGRVNVEVRPFPRVRRWGPVTVAAAAVLAALLLIPWGEPAGSQDLLAMASSVPAHEIPGGSQALTTAPWQVLRGVEGDDSGAEEARITRAGIRLADLAAAAAAGDAGSSAMIARDLAGELAGVVGGGPVSARLRAAADRAAAGASEWRAATDAASAAVVEVFDSDALRVGLWLETVRLAALAGDAGTLGSRALQAAGRSLAESSGDGQAERIGAVVNALEAGTAVQEPDLLLRILDDLGDR